MKSIENWWNGKINWETPAGRLLREFAAVIPKDRPFHLTLFGSAALQLTVDETLLSADVDVFGENEELLESLVKEHGFGPGRAGLHLEPSYELSFRTSPRWLSRATTATLGNVKITIPHPLDILISKLGRLSAKDLEAWRRVVTITGHPTADELKAELMEAVDLFSPAFDENSPNLYEPNTAQLWREIYGGDIDVRREIIEPALEKRKKGYGQPPKDYKALLF